MTTPTIDPYSQPQNAPTVMSTLWTPIGVGVDLMPPEVIEARRVRAVGLRCGAALIALIVLLAAVVGLSKFQTSRAEGALADEQTTTVALQSEQRKYSEVAVVQGQIAAIQLQLGQLMSADISWSAFIGAVRGAAPDGVTIATLTSSVTDPNALTSGGANGYGVLDMSGQGHIGILTITGSAPDAVSVAAYSDALAAVTGLAVPYPTYSGDADGLTFTINAVVTETLLTNRYATAAPVAPGSTGTK